MITASEAKKLSDEKRNVNADKFMYAISDQITERAKAGHIDIVFPGWEVSGAGELTGVYREIVVAKLKSVGYDIYTTAATQLGDGELRLTWE